MVLASRLAATMTSPSLTKTRAISALPIPPPAQRLQDVLSPCPPVHADPQPTFIATLKHTPSSQRRSTTFKKGHYSYVTPLPIAFPYRLPVKLDDEGQPIPAMGVEEWLTTYEPLAQDPEAKPNPDALLQVWSSGKRDWPAVLLSVSGRCRDECLPHLDLGDALELVKRPLAEEEEKGDSTAGESEARNELVGVLAGREVLMHIGSGVPTKEEYKPWSLRYGGRQFGSWAGQLGDGRAISLLETITPSGSVQEIQLKGSGRTPFSRHADGLAVLRSSIREYLGAENASAFPSASLPTSRSLTLALLPTLQVLRENGPEPGAIVSRIAPSFLRIGSFEILNPPSSEFVFSFGSLGGFAGAPKPDPEWEALRTLAQFVKGKLWEGENGRGEEKTAWEMVREISRRNAEMVAGWQAWGFMHGVINTDNVSVLGLTIDYGPFAYMDVFDRDHICNHSDDTGRYSYRAQPEMVFFAISSLLKATSELIGYEAAHGNTAAPADWASDASKEDLTAWRKASLERDDELHTEFTHVFEQKYNELMTKRLGLAKTEDLAGLLNPLLDLLARYDLDFHASFRTLSSFTPSSSASETVNAILASAAANGSCSPTAGKELEAWLKTYSERLGESPLSVDERKKWNPRFVLRQWVLEEIIKKTQTGETDARVELNKLLEMAVNPFEPWGAEGKDELELSDVESEERRLCGLGDTAMLGFQCSCSS